MDRLEKLFITWGLLLFALGFLVIPQHRTGYTLSLYTQLPGWLLAVGGISIIGSAIVSLWHLRHGKHQIAIVSQAPLHSVFINLLTLPWLLGYEIRGGDELSHAGDAATILLYGGVPDIPRTLFSAQRAPNLHFLTAELSLVADAAPNEIFHLLRLMAPLVFVLIVVVFSRRIGVPSPYPALLAPIAILTAVNPSSFIYPTLFILLLFVWTLRARHRSARFGVILILEFAAAWGYHIVPSLLVVGLMSLVSVFATIDPQTSATKRAAMIRNSFVILLIGGLFGYLRFTSSHYFRLAAYRVFLPTHWSSTSVADVQTTASTFNYTLLDLVQLAVKWLGDWGMIFGLALLGTVLMYRHHTDLRQYPLLLVVGVVFVLTWSAAELVIGNLVAGWRRALRPGVVIGVILAAGGSYLTIHRQRRRGMTHSVLVVLVILVVVGGLCISVANAHRSPWLDTSNDYHAESEMDGWEWYFGYKDTEKPTLTLGHRIDRSATYLLPVDERKQRQEELQLTDPPESYQVPPNLGYPKQLGVATTDAYYVSSSFVRQNRLIVHPEWEVLRPSDLRRVRADPTVSKIYANGNLIVRDV